MLRRLRERIGGHSEAGRRPVPFIVGVSRSGTTLLRLMLDAHPQLAMPPETHFIPQVVEVCDMAERPREAFMEILTTHQRWRDHQVDEARLREKVEAIRPFDVGDALRAFYEVYAERFGKPRWGDKTPGYLRSMDLIREVLPEARFVHLVRDGRDVAVSGRNARLGRGTLEQRAEQWRSSIQMARDSAGESGYYMELRYEDLVTDPEAALRRVCGHVDLPWSDTMLDYHSRAAGRISELGQDLPSKSGEDRVTMHMLTSKPPQQSRIGVWKQELSQDEVESFESVAGEMLSSFGYERVT